MKTRAKQYAQALYEALEYKDQEQAKAVVDNFMQFLVRNRDLPKADKILKHFDNIWNNNKGITEAKAITSTEMDKETLDLLKEYISQTTQAREVKINNGVDKDILGGFIVRYQGKIIDASLRTQVKRLKKFLVK